MRLKHLLSLAFLFLSVFAVAQPGDRDSRLYPKDTIIVRKGSRTEMTVTFHNTTYKQVLRFRNGVKDGIQETYNEHGQLIEKTNYKNGFPDGEQLLYDPMGQLLEKSRYKYHKKDKRITLEGTREIYSNNVLMARYTYKDSLKNGPYATYDFNGKLQELGMYEDDLRTGRNTRYHADGRLLEETNYTIFTNETGRTSLRHGEWKAYGHGGGLSARGMYDKGKRTGLWREWNPVTKVLLSETEYKNDKKHGILKSYADEGKLQRSTMFYEEIELDGQLLRNVNDGKLEQYAPDGTLQSVNHYKMGKLHGTWLHYFDNGALQSERHYEDNLETGTSVYYEADGKKGLEVSFAIIEENDKKISVKNGDETFWKAGVMTGHSTYIFGKREGPAAAYFLNGKPEWTGTFRDGRLEGEYLYYHDNGRLRYRKTYMPHPYNTYSDGSPASVETGWSEEYDREGRLVARRFHGPKDAILVAASYTDGILQSYVVDKRFEAAYFPDGKLMSVKINGTGTEPLAFYFYRNGSLRKLKFEDFGTLAPLNAEFNDKGGILRVYDQQGIKKEVKTDVADYAKTVNPQWGLSPLFNDIEKQGRYTLNFTNGRTFLDASFKDNLPHGDFVVYEPLHGDTLCYARYTNGLQTGRFIEKFAGRQVVAKGSYHDNGQPAADYRYNPNGKPWFNRTLDTLGHTATEAQYYDNGKLKSRHNHKEGTSAQYSETGLMEYEIALVPGKEGWKVNRQYYPGTKQLKRESFYAPAGVEGADTGYYPDGKMEFRLYVADGKRTGPYVHYDKQGNLMKEGQYVNGEMHGTWVIYSDGKREADYYDMGKRIVGEPVTACGCADTSLPNSSIKFAPTLEGLSPYKAVQRYLPPYLIPADEFNYGSIFYVGLQMSNGQESGFSSMKLLPYKPLALYLPADKQVKLTLNPCATRGYISNMELNSNYNFNSEENSFTTLYPKRIMLELPGSPLKSADPDYACFTMLFDVEDIRLERWQFSINRAEEDSACYSAGLIKNFLHVTVEDAEPWLFRSPSGVYKSPEGNGMALTQRGDKDDALDNFFGIRINMALVSFSLTAKGETLTVNARAADIYAGGKLVTGSITIPLMAGSTADVYKYTDGSMLLEFTADDIKKQWAAKGFTRLETAYREDSTALEVTFYAE